MAEQISYDERVRRDELWRAGWLRSEIAKTLRRHPATIGREIARNGVDGKYSAAVAQQRAPQRKAERPRVAKMDRKPIRDAMEDDLIPFWSPDQIAGRQQLTCQPSERVSANTISRWIRRPSHWRHRKQFLRRRGGAAYQPRKPAKRRTQPLAQRPAAVERRERLGDLEGQPGTGGLLTLVDRKSRFSRLKKFPDKTARRVHRKFGEALGL